MSLPRTTIKLQWVDRDTGTPSPTVIDAWVGGPIRRTLGSGDDAVTLIVRAEDWPAGFTDGGEFRIIINGGQGAGAALTLAGYTLRQRLEMSYGRDTGLPGAQPTAGLYRVRLVTDLSMRRHGYGNLVTAGRVNESLSLVGENERVRGTLNELDANAMVDTSDPYYRTNRDLVQVCLDALGMPIENATSDLDAGIDGAAIDAPGPLDWGNARPLSELEDLLTRIGWSVVQLNNGTVAVRRLLRAGQAVTIPPAIAQAAEPYQLVSTPAVRSNKIVVTSGATRATVITRRSLSIGTDPQGVNPLEFVVYDPASNQWTAQGAGALAQYKAGLTPGDTSPAGARALGQLYRAVRLTGSDLRSSASFVNIPTDLDTGDFAAFAGAPGVVEARCCIKLAGEQLLNVPALDTDPLVRVEGLRAIPGAGVFVLPTDAEFVRMALGLSGGRRGDARELTGDDLRITFAHESNTGVFRDDYFVVGFTWDIDAGTGAITLTPMIDATGETDPLGDALADPSVVKVGAPILRRVVTWEEGLGAGEEPNAQVSLNSDTLTDIAGQIAMSYLSSAAAVGGPIELRGIIDISPGDLDGAVSSVSWDPIADSTIITINQHEMPDSFYDRIQRIAGRSVTSGIGALRLGRSSASLSGVRATLIPDGRTGGAGGGVAGAHTPESAPALRGRARSIAGMTGSIDSGVRARSEMATVPEIMRIEARITGSASIGANRFEYDWEEVRYADGDAVTTGAVRKSSTHGKARNRREMDNSAAGVQGNGIDVANLVGTFAIQPLPANVGTIELVGPYTMSDGTPFWLFQDANGVDGECPAP